MITCPTCGGKARKNGKANKSRKWICVNGHRWRTPLEEIQASSSPKEEDFYLPELKSDYNQSEVEKLIEAKAAKYQEKFEKYEEERIKVFPAGSKPIAIVHFGDPHLDDNGCDLPLIKEHVQLIKNQRGVLAGNIGDNTNNWVGRLAKLYASQSTTFEEAMLLAEWLIRSSKWLYFVNGNHDNWGEGSYILKLLMRGTEVFFPAQHEARIDIRFDNNVSIKLVARHNMKGSSIWHVTHGAKREGTLDPWGDILISGHTHEWGLIQWEGRDSRPRWGLKVRGYKRMDSYAQENGFYDHKHGASCCTVIDPYVSVTERVRVFWDVAEGLKYLKKIRG